MKLNKNRIFNLLFALLGLVYVAGLLIYQTSDSGKYAAISKTIYESGDWINLKLHSLPYDQKPPLLFWLGAISFHLFGVSNVAFKIPTLIFALLAFYSIYRLGKLLHGETTGKLAALVYATTEMCILYNADIHTDSLLTSNVIFGIWQVAEYLKNKKWHHFLLGFMGIGLAMMSKGPIGLAVPVFAIGTHLIMHRDFKNIFHPRWILAAIILAFMISPALIGLFRQFGWEGIEFYFWTNNAGRISGNYTGGNTDYFFYIHTMLYILMPWSIFSLLSFFMEFKYYFKKKWKIEKNDEFFTLAGSLFFLIILSIARGKAPHYMMIVTPLISILTAKWMVKIFQTAAFPKMKKALTKIQYGYLCITWVLTLIIPLYIWPTKNLFFWAVLILLGSLFIVYFIKEKTFEHLKVVSITSILALNFVLFTIMIPSMFDYMASVQVCKTYNKEADENAILYSYLCENDELYFYAKGESYYLHNEDQLKESLSKPNSWFYTNEAGYEHIMSLNPTLEKVYSYDHKKVSKPKPKFIMPSTRESSLQIRYLLKTGKSGITKIKKMHFKGGEVQGFFF